MPVIRYFLIVGSILIVGIWWVGHDTTGPVPNPRSAPEKWTALDSLRAIAHHGDHRSAEMLPHLEAVPQRPPEASPLLITKPIVPSISPARKNASAGTDSTIKTMAKTQVRKASAAHHRKHVAQGRRPAKTRIAASDQPAPAFFSLSILQ